MSLKPKQIDLVVKAGYDHRQALTLFEHLRREIEIEGIKEPFFFGTHPNVQQRIENVSGWLASELDDRFVGVVNGPIFRARLKRLMLVNVRLDLRQGRFTAARRGVEKYLLINSEDARACYLFGEILRQRGVPDDGKTALSWYEKAVALDPSFAEAFQAMGMIHYKKGHRRLARKYFQTCLVLAPDTPDRTYIEGYLKQCTVNQKG